MAEQELDHNDARLAVLESKLEDDRQELRRVRDRIHDLAGKVTALMHLGRQVDTLTESVEGLKRDLPKIVRDASEQVAGDVMERGMERREELERERWGLKAQWVAAGISFGALVVSLAFLFVR